MREKQRTRICLRTSAPVLRSFTTASGFAGDGEAPGIVGSVVANKGKGENYTDEEGKVDLPACSFAPCRLRDAFAPVLLKCASQYSCNSSALDGIRLHIKDSADSPN